MLCLLCTLPSGKINLIQNHADRAYIVGLVLENPALHLGEVCHKLLKCIHIVEQVS